MSDELTVYLLTIASTFLTWAFLTGIFTIYWGRKVRRITSEIEDLQDKKWKLEYEIRLLEVKARG